MATTEKRPVIEVTGLKKQYKLGQIGGGTLTCKAGGRVSAAKRTPTPSLAPTSASSARPLWH